MRRTTRTTFVAAIVAALTVFLGTFAWAADLDAAAVLSTDALVPSEVAIGNNGFTIKLSASGNLDNERTASVVNKYFMDSAGTITASTASTDRTSAVFAPRHYTQGCAATGAPLGCAANPHEIAATLVVATGTANNTAGSFQISHTGAQQLSADSNLQTYRVKVVVSSGPDCTTGRSSPAAPSISLAGSPSTTTWFNAASAAGAEAFTISPGTNAEYSLSGGTSWTTYPNSAVTLGDGNHSVIARNFLAATTDCARVNGTASSATAIKIDRTAPDASPASVTNTTWRNSPLSETFTFSDASSGSGLAANQGLTNNQFAITVSAESTSATQPTADSKTVYDVAGNSVARSVSALIDLTKPTSSVSGPADGATYVSGFVPATSCVGSDVLSGIASAFNGTLSTVDNATAGVKTVSCNGAKDNAGNIQTVASASVSYTVLTIGGYNTNFDGNSVLTAKAGSAIPLNWAFSNGTSNVDILDHVTASQATVTTCSADQTPETAALENATASGSSGLQRLEDGSYQFNWKSVKGETGCRRLTIRMYTSTDNTELVAMRSVTVNFTK